jgi:anaerobic ribonucleoside-triphosphate reductase activating protein
LIPTKELVRLVEQVQPPCEGITVSGGEPLEQSAALLSLLRHVRSMTHFSTVLFSGYSLHEIRLIAEGPDIIAHVDVLVAGRFIEEQRLASGLLGSSNQEIHVLSDRYCLADLEHTSSAEITIDVQGHVRVSGLDPPHLSGSSECGAACRLRYRETPHEFPL